MTSKVYIDSMPITLHLETNEINMKLKTSMHGNNKTNFSFDLTNHEQNEVSMETYKTIEQQMRDKFTETHKDENFIFNSKLEQYFQDNVPSCFSGSLAKHLNIDTPFIISTKNSSYTIKQLLYHSTNNIIRLKIFGIMYVSHSKNKIIMEDKVVHVSFHIKSIDIIDMIKKSHVTDREKNITIINKQIFISPKTSSEKNIINKATEELMKIIK
jgi:hypothetical protein